MTFVDTHASAPRADLERVQARLRALFDPAKLAADPIAMVRQAMLDYAGPDADPPLPGTRVEPVSAGGVAAEWVVAEGSSPDDRLVYCHGGAWLAGSPDVYRSMVSVIARLSGVSILVLDYRLAPEHPFPAGLEDCIAAYRWAEHHGPGGRVAPAATLSIAGDSAGGALAVAACAAVIEGGGRTPDRLALLSPQLDVNPIAGRIARNDPTGTTEEGLWLAYQLYVGGADIPATDARISPLRTPADRLRRFPPTIVQASGDELLAYDARRFGALLDDAGVRSTLSIWPALPHVWHFFVGILPEAREALAELAAFLAIGDRAAR